MSPAGILQTEMDEDALIELEIQQELEGINVDAEEGIPIDGNNNDLENIGGNQVVDEKLDDAQVVPKELEGYIKWIQKQRHDFEQELEEVDTILNENPAKPESEGKMMVYSDWKELEEAAAKDGLTVQEFRQKLLKEIENDPFELEQLDFGSDDFEENWKIATRTSLTDAFRHSPDDSSSPDAGERKAIEAAERQEEGGDRKEGKDGKEGGVKEEIGSGEGEGGKTEEEGSMALVPVKQGLEMGDGDDCSGKEWGKINETDSSTVMVIHRISPLAEFEKFLREQMAQAEERYCQREIQLKEELRAKRAVEEKLMLALEEQRLKIMHNMKKEEQELASKKQERQRQLDHDTEEKQKVLERELVIHEETIATLSEMLEEDRHCLEKTRRANVERLAQQNNHAALTIQRFYRGYMVRKLHEGEKRTLAERTGQRRLEKEQRRIAEVQKEMDERKEADKRRTEEERQKQEAEIQRVKEEEERKLEAERKLKEEEERKKKEKEERKQKEAEEKQRREEEKRRKKEEEEERKQKEIEEKRRRKEEEKRLREEEKLKRKEEDERKKLEDEERKKNEEERKRKEDEDRKRKEEEEQLRKEEEERQYIEAEEKRKREEKDKLNKEKIEKLRLEQEKKKEEEKKKSEVDKQTQQDVKKGEREQAENSQKTKPVDQAAPAKTEGVDLVAETQASADKEEEEFIPFNPDFLPQHLEKKHLSWMKSCLPWSKVSNEPWKIKAGAGGKATRRPPSAKKLSPIPSNVLLAAAQVASLRQVTTVELCDLPGHSLSTLGQCVQLKHLKVTRCGIASLEHLSACKHLQCINAQDNHIEYVDLKELCDLYVVNLSNNKLTTIHGLDGCTNVRMLDVSHNRLTKLEGLSPLRRLHTLIASNNQMVSTSGLEHCPSIQKLDLSANYLTTVRGLDLLGILIMLNISSNNLTQMPNLENSVLLQDLILRENSIGPIVDISLFWLPLLTTLDLSQNIIEEMTGTGSGLFALKRLDLAVNQIVDLPSFLPVVSECPRLEDLSVLGNAVLGEDNLRDNLKNAIPHLRCLNGETVRTQSELPWFVRTTNFAATCLAQVQLHKDIRNLFEVECRAWDVHPKEDGSHVCDDYFKFCDKSFKMSVEHRYNHEYGGLSYANIPAAPSTPRSSHPLSSRSPRVSAKDQANNRTSARSFADTFGDGASAQKNSRSSPQESTTCDKFSQRNGGGQKGSAEENLTASPRKSFSSDRIPDLKNNMDKSVSLKLDRSPGIQDVSLVSQSSSSTLVNATTSAATLVTAKNSASETSEVPVLSEKEKFELALRGGLPIKVNSAVVTSSRHQDSIHGATLRSEFEENSSPRDVSQGAFGAGRMDRRRKSLVAADSVQTPQLSAKEKFERTLAGLSSEPTPHQTLGGAKNQMEPTVGDLMKTQGSVGPTHVTADKIGGLLSSEDMQSNNAVLPSDRSPLPKMMDADLDDLEEMMEGLQFDLDGFLDLDQFEFDENILEKGWRPEDTPQLPPSYPLLGRIPSSAGAKPPLPPVPALALGSHHTPVPPPGKPVQAWRNAESPLSDLQGRLQLRPPSSVTSGEDSHAVTTGRSKREEKIAEDWGFKDSRTAELMMQRAKKMKYNAERRNKLSKLDPQQRLKLFRKIEEVTRIHSVRPPAARVLPRKEYFQAREEEAQQKDLERQMEMRTKAGRTFEWIHTQVGDYDISSSCINQRPVVKALEGESPLIKATSDTQLPQQQYLFQLHSAMSDDPDYMSHASGQRPHYVHRNSLPGSELTITGKTTTLPPINTGSAPSDHSREREKLSWRTEEVEKSVGWGGGKKRSVRK